MSHPTAPAPGDSSDVRARVSASRASAIVENFWAIGWRMAVLSLVFHLPAMLGIALTIGGGATMAVMGLRFRYSPVLGLLRGRSPFQEIVVVTPTPRDPSDATVAMPRPRGYSNFSPSVHLPKAPETDPDALPDVPQIERATGRGRLTGFEPNILEDVPVPQEKDFPRMTGSPGSGLDESGFGSTNIELGQRGEVNFAKALALNGFLEKYDTFWSVNRRDFSGEFSGADVDCIILTSETIWLLDMKYYSGGDATYRTHGNMLCLYDNKTGSRIGKPRKMSRNMEIAERIFSEDFSRYSDWRVISLVILIPPPMGCAEVDDGACWPGGVWLRALPDALGMIGREEPADNWTGNGAVVTGLLEDLVKR